MPDIKVPYNWEPRDYQKPALQFFQWGGLRAVLIWHRRAGKDTFGLNLTTREAFMRVGLYWHVFPTYNMGRKIIWNGMTGDGRPFKNFWPPDVVTRDVDDEMYLELVNGSRWQVVGTDDPDRLVGSNPVGVVFSEYSLMNPVAWDLIRPILAENGGWALFIYTPRSRNHGWNLLQTALRNPPKIENNRFVGGWFSQVLTVDNTTKIVNGKKVPVITKAAIDDDRASGMDEPKVQQEYWCSFDAALEGSYYGEQMRIAYEQNRITVVNHEPQLPVSTMWDLGVGDANAIWFFQEIGREVRFIDYHEDHGKGMGHYAGVLAAKALEHGYVYESHYGPHDLSVTEYSTGRRRVDVALDLKLRFTIVQKHKIEDGIEATRNLLPRCWFDAQRCEKGIAAIQQYHKTFDEVKRTFAEIPFKDWTSHGADALRTGAWGIRKKGSTSRPDVADNTYNPLDERTIRQRRDLPQDTGDYNPFGGS